MRTYLIICCRRRETISDCLVLSSNAMSCLRCVVNLGLYTAVVKGCWCVACLPLIKACGMATPIFLRTGTLGWPSPSDGLTQLSLPGMVGKLVCSFNVYYGSADGLAQGITTSWARPHVLPGLNMPLGIMSTGPGLILVPSFLPTLLFFGIHYTSFPSVWS